MSFESLLGGLSLLMPGTFPVGPMKKQKIKKKQLV